MSTPPESFGRYLLYPAIARGGMATVHTARLMGAEGFSRLVAAKRLHPQLTDDPDFVTMFHDEACIASRIHHPNVVPVLDVVVAGQELILVQEYVHGVPLSALMKGAHLANQPIAVDVAIAILTGVLAGLHAAHEAKDEIERPLEIIHRDVSPQNVMVSVDGMPRLLDFGIAKARTSTHHTREGVFKGKLAYMAPEQLRMEGIDRTIDIYATGVLAWELLVNRRIYDGRHELAFVTAVMRGEIPTLTQALEDARDAGEIADDRWSELVALEPIVLRAMSADASDRFASAADMARALLEVRPSATSLAVAEWVRAAGAEFLDERQRTLAANEESWRRTSVFAKPPSSIPPAPSSSPEPSSRSARALPWLAALSLLLVAIVGIALLYTTPTPQIALIESPSPIASSPSSASSSASTLASASALAPAPALSLAAAPARPHPVPPPPPPVPQHTPPPAPPQSLLVPRPAPPVDCNPPFFFEGTKKVFKPSCL